MTTKSEYLIDLILKKLKNYKGKEINLDKDNLRKFIFLLLEESWIKIIFNPLVYNNKN